MGIFLDYWWKAECSEDELVERLERLRDRVAAFDVERVSEVIRVEPVCNPVFIDLALKEGVTLPKEVEEALERKTPSGKAHGSWCIYLDPMMGEEHFPKRLLTRYYRPLKDFLDSSHGLWDEASLPESIERGSLTIYRKGISAAFAEALLKYGFLFSVDVDPGCESFVVGLSGYRNARRPLWIGSGGCKTQYSERFIHAHETLCRIMDMAREEGLLTGGDDTCGFYHHRDWSKSAEIVNMETTFARAMSMILAGAAEKSGGTVEVISAPALKSYNLINIKPAADEGRGGPDGGFRGEGAAPAAEEAFGRWLDAGSLIGRGCFMWDLEYLLLFGVPGNKWELLHGRVRWVFPFRSRDVAEAHFVGWTETLRRWRDVADTAVQETTTADGSPRRIVRFDGVEMSLYPLPIELRMRMDMAVFDALYFSFWRRDLWPGQDPGKETGRECAQRHSDVQLNLWRLFGQFCDEFGGKHCGRSVIAMDDRNAVEPDQYYFHGPRGERMIGDDYFQGVPRLVAEVLSPATRALDRGPRLDVYRRAGVPHVWLLDPETEMVEEYALTGREFSRTGRHGPGETLPPRALPRAIGRRGRALRYAGEASRVHERPGRARTSAGVVDRPRATVGA